MGVDRTPGLPEAARRAPAPGVRPRGGWPRPCRAPRRRRRGSARTRCCGAAARCGRRAGGSTFTVASPSSIAATMSPFSAVCCDRTTTQSPSQIAASIIDSPTTFSMNSSPLPTSWRGSGKTSSICCSAVIGMPAAIRPTSGTIAASPTGTADVGLDGRRGRHADDDLERARPLRVAAEVAGQLELLQLVGDARERREPDGVADLAHARRVAAGRDRPLDHLEDRLLLRRSASVRRRVPAARSRVSVLLGHRSSSSAPRRASVRAIRRSHTDVIRIRGRYANSCSIRVARCRTPVRRCACSCRASKLCSNPRRRAGGDRDVHGAERLDRVRGR